MADSLSARNAILTRIREKLGNKSEAAEDVVRYEHASIARLYQRDGKLNGEKKLQLFVERLEDYDAHVVRTTSDGVQAAIDAAIDAAIGAAIGAAIEDGNISNILVPVNFPTAWLPTSVAIVRDENSKGMPLANNELDRLHTVLTTASAGIAETGTLVLEHGAGEGRRALTLVPDRHICVVRASQVVETVPEAFTGIQQRATQPITLISGPSATSDIEMTRIRGVHGPRNLVVILVDGV